MKNSMVFVLIVIALIGIQTVWAENTITATLVNSDYFTTHWEVIDVNSNKKIVDQEFAPGGRITVYLMADGSGYGEIKYRRKGNSVWSKKVFIENGDTVSLWG